LLQGKTPASFLAAHATAGGALSGTYPNPTIATGAITTAKFAAGAQAPDAAQLNSLPASDYGAVLSGRIDSLRTTSGTDFGVVSGISTANTDDAHIYTLSPARDMVARDLSVRLTSAPGFDRTLYLSVNSGIQDGSGNSLECTVSGDSATTCTATGPMSVPAGSTLSLADNTDGSVAAADVLFALRLTPS
jgi:hypothetical protein